MLLVALDQWSKLTAPNVYNNFDFAFSIRIGFYVMYSIYYTGIVWIIIYLTKHFYQITFKDRLGWLLILAGAVSNVGERIVLGYVRDWIYIASGVFNLADGYIMVGIAILLFFNQTTKIKKTT